MTFHTEPRRAGGSRLLSAAALAAGLLFLHGCGGDDDEPPPPPPPPPPAATVTLTGVALAGGALQSAKVCLDLNDNRVCDGTEPSATTSATGSYSVTALESDAPAHALLAEAPATAVDAAAGTVSGPFTLAAPAGRGAVISPYTTLLQSEVDSGRSPNVAQAEELILSFLVGIAGDVGGLTLSSNYLPDATEIAAQGTKRLRMQGLAQLLTEGFVKTRADRSLTGKALISASGLAAVGSLQQVTSQLSVLAVTTSGTTTVSTGPLTADQRTALFNALKPSLVPTAANLADIARAAAKTAAAPIEGAWIKTTGSGTATVKELYLFAGDGTFVHQVVETGAPATSTAFDSGFGYRFGRYTLTGTTLTTSVLAASNASGPGSGTMNGVTIAGNTLTADGGVTLTRVTSTTNPLVGGWIRPDGSSEPEFLVMFDDGTYTHSTFYYQNDPQTGTASFFETAKTAGLRKGAYTVDATNAKLVNFGETTVAFNGTLAIPSNPGVAVLQPDNSLSMTGLRLLKLGTADGAKAVSGFSEATLSRLWAGRYFSRTIGSGATARLQYVYVRGVDDVLTFLQAPTGSDATVACGSTAATQTTTPDFTSVTPADGKLKQFVVGTGTAASAGYAQRRLNVGLPASFVTYTPIARPSNTTARCALPV